MFGFEDGGLQGKEFNNLVTFFYVSPTYTAAVNLPSIGHLLKLPLDHLYRL